MERWPRNRIAKSISIKHNSGINASNLLSPESQNPFYKKSSLLTSTTTANNNKTNHQQLHRKALKEMQMKKEDQRQQQKIKEEQEKEKMFRLKKKHYEKVKSKVFDNLQNINSPVSTYEKKLSTSFDDDFTSISNISILESSNDKENIGMNKYSKRMSYPIKKSHEKVKDGWNVKKKNNPSTNNNNKNAQNYVSHKSFGKIPHYIKERKAELANEQKRRQETTHEDEHEHDTDQNNCSASADMVRMSDAERLETLRLLNEAEEKVKSDLLKLPLALQTHGAIKKRDKLELKLEELEEAREIFSRDKVYIQQV